MTKFKVGDKVSIVKDGLVVGTEYNGGCLFVSDMKRHLGKKAKIVEAWNNDKNGEDRYKLNISEWTWTNDMLRGLNEFTKADLKDGMVVEYRNGKRRMVLGDIFTNDGFVRISEYDDNLIHNHRWSSNPDVDIVKVYKSSARVLTDWFDDCRLTLVWERGEEHKEMTVAEIEEKLGYKIKVIADKE